MGIWGTPGHGVELGVRKRFGTRGVTIRLQLNSEGEFYGQTVTGFVQTTVWHVTARGSISLSEQIVDGGLNGHFTHYGKVPRHVATCSLSSKH